MLRQPLSEQICVGSIEHRVKRTPPGIVSTCRLLAVATTLACGGCTTAAEEVHDTVVTPSGQHVVIRMVIRREHAGDARRFLAGAIECVRILDAFDIAPRGEITAIDPPRGGATSLHGNDLALEPTPWWSSPAAMVPELAAARAIARRAWSHAIGGSLPSWFAGALAEYTARRGVMLVFQKSNLTPGFAMLDMRYLGDYVPWRIRIRLEPDGTTDQLPAYRRRPAVDPRHTRSSDDERILQAKALLTLNTLERWIGRPAFDAALAEFARQARARPLALADFTAVAGAAAGQDLSWMLSPMLTEPVTYDYAVAEVRSDAARDGRFDTRVTIERRGDGQFTGAAAPRIGPFDSGRGITILTTFADGDRVADTWDGRDRRKTFRYRSAARAASAVVDPDGKLLLDLHRANNSVALEPKRATAATRWSIRWMVWLQQVLLTYGALA